VSESALDDATLARLRAEAADQASPFTDPALYRDAGNLMHLATGEWLARVMGRPARPSAWRYFSNSELALCVAAMKADRAYLIALAAERAAERQRAAQAETGAWIAAEQAERDKWEALRGQLPVPVAVWHNWTARHLDGYEQGADHIVVLEDLNAGRFRRTARSPLCWTPSRARPLRHVTPNVGDEKRLPDCKACLRHADRLAGQAAG
jgi:hypothetical protein